ncbi:MFS transporter [Streptomyces sp. NPDC048606]|uniref:MFS transporter n=1 Tax=Streptomyces sp. NPDC048606 TaxID=3154726 RepID=UPI00342C6E2A
MDEASINVKTLHGLLTDDHFSPVPGADAGASRVPPARRMYEFLNGKILTREMAEAVIDVTTRDAALEQARLTRVRSLFRKIDEDPTPAAVDGAVFRELQRARKDIATAQGEIDTLRHAQRLSDQACFAAQAVAITMHFQFDEMRNTIDSLTRERARLKAQAASLPAAQAQLVVLQSRLERARRSRDATAATLREAERDRDAARKVADEATRLLLEKEREIARLREAAAETVVVEEPAARPEADPAEEPAAVPPEYESDVLDTAEIAVDIARERLERNREAVGEASKELGLVRPADKPYIVGVVVPPPREGLSRTSPDNLLTGQDTTTPPPSEASGHPAAAAPPPESLRPPRPRDGEEDRGTRTRTRERLVMAVVCTAVTLCSFSASAALLVLPQIRDSLSLTPNATHWVIAGDLAGLAAGLLWCRPVQARATGRSLFLTGALVLAAGCFLAVPPWGPGATWLAVGRVLQGLGQGLLLASLLPLVESVRTGRPRPGKTGYAFPGTAWSRCAAAFAVAGLGTGIAAAVTTRWWGWEWIFRGPLWLSGLLAVAAFLALPPDPAGVEGRSGVRRTTRLHLLVTGTRLAGLLIALVGIGQAYSRTWLSPFVLVPLAAGLYAVLVSTTWNQEASYRRGEEGRRELPPDLPFPSQNLVAVLDGQVLYVAPVYLVLHLYDALGHEVLATAALMCAVIIPQAAASWVDHDFTLLGRRRLHALGLLCAAGGLLWTSWAGGAGGGSLWGVLTPLVVIGVGSAAIRLGQAPPTASFPQALWSTTCAAGALGVAVAGTIADVLLTGYRHGGVAATDQQIFAHAYGDVLSAVVVCALVAFLVVAGWPTASGGPARPLPAFLDGLPGWTTALVVSLVPAVLAAIGAAGFRRALDTDPQPDVGFLALYVLLGLTALVVITSTTVVGAASVLDEATSGKPWTLYSDLLTFVSIAGAIAGVPLGAFVGLGPLTTAGVLFADFVGLY